MMISNDVKLVALSAQPFNCRGDFSALRTAVEASGIPELDKVLRAGVHQLRRNGMLREPDVLAIQDVLNSRLAELKDDERAAIVAAEKASKAGLVTDWLARQLLEE